MLPGVKIDLYDNGGTVVVSSEEDNVGKSIEQALILASIDGIFRVPNDEN